MVYADITRRGKDAYVENEKQYAEMHTTAIVMWTFEYCFGSLNTKD